MRALFAIGYLLAGGGCDLLFGLSGDIETDQQRDAMTDPDRDSSADVPPPIGMDDDQDGIANRDDKCPGDPAADGVDPDFDEDGVGDACDPLPESGCTTRVAFLSFETLEPGLVAPSPPNGEWSYNNHDLVQNGLGDQAAFYAISSDLELTIRAKVSSIMPEVGQSRVRLGVGVAEGVPIVADDGFWCELALSTTASVGMWDISANSGNGAAATSYVPLQTSPAALQGVFFSVTKKALGIDCSVQLDGLQDAQTHHLDISEDPTLQGIILGTKDAKARFQWLDVIKYDSCPL